MIFKNEKLKKVVAVYLAFSILFSIISPTAAFALTGGPSQAEYESFEPAGASEMVNMFTGDFTYNIPLLDVDGYPVNISYHAGISPEQEASWVGLGWSLNPGAITRGMRGLPDDFDGDVITNTINIKPNKIYGINTGGGIEVVGLGGMGGAGLEAGFGIIYNNYKGLGFELNFGTSGSLQASYMGAGGGLNAAANLRVSSQDGVDFTAAAGLGASIGMGAIGSYGKGLNWSATVNSRNGLTENKVGGSSTVGKFFVFGGMQQTEINLVPNTAYSPNLQYPMVFSGFSGDFHAGGQYYWINGHSYNRGFVYEQGLQSQTNSVRSFGYLNLEHADNSSATDFNRDQDGVYYLECPKLPAATLTYDMYNVNAQGLGLLFRPFRNDVGAIFDNFVNSSGSTSALSIETNYGNYGELGINNHDVQSTSSSGKWVSNNLIGSSGNVGFKGNNKFSSSASGSEYESSYFKNMMEYTFSDPDFDQRVGNDQLSTFNLQPSGTNTSSLTNHLINNGTAVPVSSALTKTKREARSDNMSFLTRKEAQLYGFQKKIENYDLNSFTSPFSPYDRNQNGVAAENHISEISVVKDDGARYIFGVPVYNREYKEVAFNAAGLSKDCGNGLVSYTAGTDNATSNSNGIDNFYLSKSTPAFAHSFLLSSVLSSDYIDRTDNGPSSDDFGDYTKFNYSKLATDYGWRVPCTGTPSKAIHNRALEADPADDKGMYMYGRKDIWYVHSLETKNYVAEFYVSDRSDANEARDENELAAPVTKLQKLDKIVLFSKQDKLVNGANATPLKTVHFVYDYFLCPNTPNSNAPSLGKLTLKEIYFTYGKSEKGRFNPFKFDYCDANHDGTVSAAELSAYNPSYKRTNIDRWGTYKVGSNDCNSNGFNLGNEEFPYSEQNKTEADKNAAVWALSSIKTPAGSLIKVSYEADDYAYVQDKVASQMVTAIDMVNSSGGTFPSGYALPGVPNVSGKLYENISGLLDPREYMVIDLENINGGIPAGSGFSGANDLFKNQCLPQSGKLYIKALVALGASSVGEQEYVPSYAQIDIPNSSLFNDGAPGGVYRYAYIKLKTEEISDESIYPGSVNPISKAAWQMTRLMHPRIAYPGSEPGSDVIGALVGLLGSMTEVLTFAEKNERLLRKGYSRFINCGKSWVRLNNISKKKIGGGHRVAKIEIEDSWNSMVATEATSTYGQTYDYTIKEDAGEPVVSSGVASYEPQIGGDENSLRKPTNYSVNHTYAPNDEHFIEDPVGEPFFPPPLVGYRQVSVRKIDHTVATGGGPVTVGNIGRTVYSFYTSKDFPIKVEFNGVDMDHYKPDPERDLFNSYLEDHVFLAQGFLIKLNDMHGKLKSILTYQEGQNDPISGISYFYKTKSSGSELENELPLITSKNQIRKGIIGRTIDMTADFRMTQTTTMSNFSTFNLNISAPLPWPYPIPIPTYFQGVSSDIRSFQSATMTKIVSLQGILEKIESIDNYTKNTVENLVWDKETGDVVVTKTTNNFKDPVYSFDCPAFWIHQGMAGAYKNIGISFIDAFNTTDGKITVTTGLVQPGDELVLYYLNSSYAPIFLTPANPVVKKYWAVKSGTDLYLMDALGDIVDAANVALMTSGPGALQPSGTAHYAMQVARSGHKNLLGAEAENLVSLTNFVGTYSGVPLTAPLVLNSKILSASSTEYSDKWNRFCANDVVCSPEQRKDDNPYHNGLLGSWRGKRSYSYLTNRLAAYAGESNIRKDGTFDVFKPFYSFSTSADAWLPVYNNLRSDYVSTAPFDKWILNGQVNKTSPFGNMSEVKDAINRYSASLYGYNNTIKIADAMNAKYRQIGFDGFEDYGYLTSVCENSHFGFIQYGSKRTTAAAHTGRYSLVISNTDNVVLNYQTNVSDCYDFYGSNNYTNPGGSVPHDPEPVFVGVRASGTPSCDCLQNFSPESDVATPQKYVISFWAKERSANNNGDYASPGIAVSIGGVPLAPTSPVKKSQIINGWQKFEYIYTIPATVGINTFSLKLVNSTGTPGMTVYFDDIRIHPFNATMKSFVYDPTSLRLWAELDERNFATFYEYDFEGLIVRVKKETEKGIVTIKEVQNSNKKQ